jgi:hypothetical protein
MLTSPAVTFDLRPSWRPSWVRTFRPAVSTSFYHRASDGRFQEGSVYIAPFQITFQDGATWSIWARPEWQRLESDFSPVPGLQIDSGNYTFAQFGSTFRPDLSNRLWAYVTFATGGYYDGRRDQAIIRIRSAPNPHVSLTFDYEGNRLSDVGLTNASRTTHLFYPEVRLALDPRLQFMTLWQYSSVSRIASWNARIAWEFSPLSYIYLVYNDRNFVEGGGMDAPSITGERHLILKVSWLRQM